MNDLSYLLPFCNERQEEIIEAYIREGSTKKAAEVLGCNPSNVSHTVNRVKAIAARKGVAPEHGMHHSTPEGFMLGKTTIQRNALGEVERTWDRVLQDSDAQLQVLAEAMDSLIENYKPFKPKKCNQQHYDKKIVPWYNIGDGHIGMLAHAMEVGENFDLKIGVRELKFALDKIISNTESRDRCVVNDLGDGTHYENMEGVTQHSGHMLDCDGRFVKMIECYLDIMIFTIERCLAKHDKVDVIVNQGNHSRTNDLWAARCLKRMYENEPRVTIIDNTSVFIAYRMDETMVLVHHSDRCKPDKLIDVLINDFREDYGACTNHYIWVGHVHHRFTSDEFRGITVEAWNNLANKDKHAHDNGYRSKQSISRVDLHREYGEVGRATLNINAVRKMILKECTDGKEHIEALGERRNINRV